MHRLISAAALSLSVAGFSTQALSAPEQDMCALVAAIAENGADGGTAYLEELSALWSEDQKAKIRVVVGSEMAKFEYKGGQVFLTASLPGVVEEYFLTLNLSTFPASVYARVLYEGDGEEMTFVNIDFNSNYYDITGRPFLQAPEEIDCSGT